MKIKKIFEWYNKYSDKDIIISTEDMDFYIKLNNKLLPHLLGLQYSTKDRLKGYKLYNFIKNKTDKEIYNNISKYNPNMLKSVKLRINNFKYFMENLDKAVLYNQTNTKTKLKSNYLLVKTNDDKYLHLGINQNESEEAYLETFIVRNDNSYFKDSLIQKKVVSIETYNEQDELVPFSFKETELDKLKEAVVDFMNRVYEENLKYDDFDKEFSDITNIPIAYTEANGYEIQSMLDIENFLHKIYINDKISTKINLIHPEETKKEGIDKIITNLSRIEFKAFENIHIEQLYKNIQKENKIKEPKTIKRL